MALRTNSIVRHFDSTRTVLTKSWAGVFVDATGAGAFTDYTTAANNETASDVTLNGTSGAILYLGLANRFGAVQALMNTARSNVALDWEYWNGSAWTALTVATPGTNGTKLADAGGNIVHWAIPLAWATTTVNSVSAYWVRAVNGATAGTPGAAAYFNAAPSYIVSATIDVPETGSRTVRQAAIRFSCHQNSVAYVLLWRASATLAAGAKTTLGSQTFDANALGSNARHVTNAFEIDATSFFVSDLSGASATLDLDITVLHEFGGAVATTATGLGNCCATLFLTYEYDDAALTTATKTIFIPIESTTTTILTSSLASIGSSSQIPALDTFCPEASKSFKEISIVLFGNSATDQSGASPNLALSLDVEAETTMCPLTIESGVGAGVFEEYHWVRNDMDTSLTHDLKVRASDGGGSTQIRYPFISGYVSVTYTYNASTSTRILNSVLVPLVTEGSETGYNTGRPSSMCVDIQVVEPGTLNLRQSAILMTFCEEGPWSGDLGFSIGAQSFRMYSLDDLTSEMAGGMVLVQRLDSGGAQGSGLTLARGTNRVFARYYTDSGGVGFCQVGGVVILNYESDKAAAGVGAHNHTTWWTLLRSGGSSAFTSWGNDDTAPVIPEANYWVNGVGVSVVGASRAAWNRAFVIMAWRTTGEREEVGKEEAYLSAGWGPQHSERLFALHSATQLFKRFPAQTNGSLMNLEASRKWWLGFDGFAKACMLWAQQFVTYHTITKTISGTVTNGSGTAQVGATVTLHRKDTGEKLGTTTTNGSGVYTFAWFDDTVEVFTQVRISGSLIGRSDDGFAS